MKDFDFYQIAGVIAPGTVVILGGVLLFFPDQQQNLLSIANVSLGSFGLGLILAYVIGQLLQAIGNGIEKLWWGIWGGMPTDWVRTGKHELIAKTQIRQIQYYIRNMLNEQDFEIASVNEKQWYAITRQIYAVISAEKQAYRVDVFNGNYGLCRGIVAGLFLLLVTLMFINIKAWKIELILLTLIVLALYRMHRFGINYGRELFIQYLHIFSAHKKGN